VSEPAFRTKGEGRFAAEMGPEDEGRLRVLVACPNCGAEITISSADRAARCCHCDSAHLVFGRTELLVFAIPNHVEGEPGCKDAVVGDLKRRRFIEVSQGFSGSAGQSRDPVERGTARFVDSMVGELVPGQGGERLKFADSVFEAEVESWALELAGVTRVFSTTLFYAPYWGVSGRLYETVVGRAANGGKQTGATVRAIDLTHNAFDDALPIPGMGKLSYLRELRPLSREPLDQFPHLRIVQNRSVLRGQLERLREVHSMPQMAAICRRSEAWVDSHHLIFRPFHLTRVESRGLRFLVLIDGNSKSIVSIIPDAEAEGIMPAMSREWAVDLGGSLALRPMRCSICGGALPLDRTDEIRFCMVCGRALRVEGDRLAEVRYEIEVPDESRGETILLPFWRFAFRIEDPRDGKSLSSINELRARLGAVGGAMPFAAEPLDVPAFRPLDRHRAEVVYQHLFSIDRPPDERFTDGPARSEYGFTRPARFVSVLEEEAGFLARQTILGRLTERDLTNVSPARIRSLLFESEIVLGVPKLILRAFRKLDVAPMAELIGLIP